MMTELSESPEMVLFGMGASTAYADKVAELLHTDLATHHEKSFVDGEVYLRSDVNVRGRDVFVICSLHGCKEEQINDRLVKLLIFVGSLKDASAGRITVVCPYLGYSRQDRKVQSREPVTTRYLAQMMEAQGVDRVLTIDVHNLSSFQGCFRCRTDHLEAKKLLGDHLCATLRPTELGAGLTICCDIGGIARGNLFREYVAKVTGSEVKIAPADKLHGAGAVRVSQIIGNVKGRTVVILDDMVASATTVDQQAAAVEKGGGKLWGVLATHGLFVGGVNENLARVPRLVVTDTINRIAALSPENQAKTTVVSTARLIADAIRRIHERTGSISDLLS
jgi:ribose-phosphate pyrophosphokinase